MSEPWFSPLWFLLVGLLALLLVWVWRNKSASASGNMERQQALLEQLPAQISAIEQSLRREIAESARAQRQELSQSIERFQQTLIQQSAESGRSQLAQMDVVGQQLSLLQKNLSDTLSNQLSGLSEANARRMGEVRETMERQLNALQASNALKLDEMRATVDEKLQTTLQARLGESFQQVAHWLEQVHKGLGDMQSLAQGVGDLKHLLTNVKTRGIFGEAQLGALLEQVFVPEQYGVQVATRPGSRNVVDFAIKLPGKGDTDTPLWLPIDAKFPNEDYERLLMAQEQADAVAAEEAGRALEQRIRLEARSIADKYIEPPHTTDFAILFLPTEGLYAEVLRRPGLLEYLQRDCRVTLAGPTTLLAMLNSLQMGFRTLAIEKRASEVWQVLGAVKSEFGKFGDVLSKIKTQAETVVRTVDSAQVRSRAMDRALKQVQALPDLQAKQLMGPMTNGSDASLDDGSGDETA